MLNLNPIQLDGLDLDGIFAGAAGFDRVGLAVSGGPDSLALMVLVRAWCDTRGQNAPQIFVYCVDHGLRPEAADETSFVTKTATELGFTGRALTWTGDKPATGVQSAARTARYALMGAAMTEDGVPVLLTAHHAGDQAETVLMRLAHGSGISGLGGMAAWSEVEGARLHRPLLGLSQDLLQKIVTRSGLTPVQDPSNLDVQYERVRWRQVAPTLAEHGVTAEGLGRLAARMQRADAALADAANAAFAAHVVRDRFGVAHLPHAELSSLPDEIAVRVLALSFAAVGRTAPRLEQLEEVLAAIGHAGFSGTCLSGTMVQPCGDALVFFAEVGRMVAASVEIAPGRTLIWDGRFEVKNLGSAPVNVDSSPQLTRAEAERFVGDEIAIPMAAIAAAPSLFDANGDQIALGLFTRSQEVKLTLAR